MKRFFVLITLLSLFVTGTLLADQRYVIDELTITVRSGRSNQHSIIKLLNSGTSVEVLEEVEENGRLFARVRAGNVEGWVHTQYLSKEPVARDRLAATENQLAGSREQVRNLKKQLADLGKEHRELGRQRDELGKSVASLEQQLAQLEKIAEKPAEIAAQNRSLRDELDVLKTNLSTLQQDYEQAKNSSERDWFIAGGGVALASIIFGILLTRVRLRPRRSSWRDSL